MVDCSLESYKSPPEPVDKVKASYEKYRIHEIDKDTGEWTGRYLGAYSEPVDKEHSLAFDSSCRAEAQCEVANTYVESGNHYIVVR